MNLMRFRCHSCGAAYHEKPVRCGCGSDQVVELVEGENLPDPTQATPKRKKKSGAASSENETSQQ